MIAKHDDKIRQLIKDPLYDIRSDGSIWSRKAPTGQVYVDKNKWRRIDFIKNGYMMIKYNYTDLQVHRIMYQKFKGNLDSNKCIYHKDYDFTNNDPNNLGMGTKAEINQRAFTVGKRAPVIGNKKLSFELACRIREDYQICGNSLKNLAKKYGVAKTTISDVVNYKTWNPEIHSN